ncbi:alkaline phosphatase [Flindersiella endophytica]
MLLTVGVVAALAGAAIAPPHLGSADGVDRATKGAEASKAKVKSVIFVNGDGMAAPHREAARLHYTGLDGRLVMDQLPVGGLLSTEPRDPGNIVTDSAAGASAWATGQKTYNGAISVDVNGNPLPVIGGQAKRAGKATGLVTTAQVTDATPAAFYSNSVNRAAQDDIARQFLEVTKPDVILGGGEDRWLPPGTPGAYPDNPPEDPSEQSSSTKGNLVERAQQLGYTYVHTPEQLQATNARKLLGLFANEEMFQQRAEGNGDIYAPVVPLADMTGKALQVLDRDRDGFFLLIEEEAIDEFAHNNNGTRTLQAMGELDKSVALARQYVARHPDTLLIVTGDHETGGMTVESPGGTDESGDGVSAEDGPFTIRGSDLTFAIDWTTTGHSGTTVPLTAIGPTASKLSGVHPNTHIHTVIAEALHLG